ncbi:hypothetical protein QBC43DRAFT_19493 [Cladorrhinum sp. PSN259]|nr:hypothetical protein QBC43DRAFT_19493 [Cladorrhinum sp. PSN259]
MNHLCVNRQSQFNSKTLLFFLLIAPGSTSFSDGLVLGVGPLNKKNWGLRGARTTRPFQVTSSWRSIVRVESFFFPSSIKMEITATGIYRVFYFLCCTASLYVLYIHICTAPTFSLPYMHTILSA